MRYVKNNIEQYRKDLTEYVKNSVQHGYYDEWKQKYLAERLKSEILSDRLRHCKEDNWKLKKQYLDVIDFIFPNSNVRRVAALSWNTDMVIAELIIHLLQNFQKKTDAVPGSIANKYNDIKQAQKEWNDILNKIIVAFKLKRDGLDYEYTPEQRQDMDEGLQLFVKFFDALWN